MKGKGMLHVTVLKCGPREYVVFFLTGQSQSSAVDGPPSTHHRSWSPSDATHNVESQSTKKDQHLGSRV